MTLMISNKELKKAGLHEYIDSVGSKGIIVMSSRHSLTVLGFGEELMWVRGVTEGLTDYIREKYPEMFL